MFNRLGCGTNVFAHEGLSNVHTRILSATAPLNMLLNYLLGKLF
jgi:hypothetical protein